MLGFCAIRRRPPLVGRPSCLDILERRHWAAILFLIGPSNAVELTEKLRRPKCPLPSMSRLEGLPSVRIVSANFYVVIREHCVGGRWPYGTANHVAELLCILHWFLPCLPQGKVVMSVSQRLRVGATARKQDSVESRQSCAKCSWIANSRAELEVGCSVAQTRFRALLLLFHLDFK